MSWVVYAEILLLCFGLALNSFTLCCQTSGRYVNFKKRWGLFIALIILLFTYVFMVAGYYIAYALSLSDIYINNWVTFFLLLFIGVMQIYEAVRILYGHSRTIKSSFKAGDIILQSLVPALYAMVAGFCIIIIPGTEIYRILSLSGIFAFICFVFAYLGAIIGIFYCEKIKGKAAISSLVGGFMVVACAIIMFVEGLI